MRTISEAAYGALALVTVVVLGIVTWELGKTIGYKIQQALRPTLKV